ncbi:MAG TPA: VWA-like domain-containing protein [Nitrospiraceae bacterium]
MAMNKQAANAISKARTQLLTREAFLGTLSLRLLVAERNDIPTMATDGTSLFYNPQFTLSLTNDECIGVVAHEVLHCALGHIWRLEGRDIELANIAMDYCVNEILIASGYRLPQGALISPDKNLSFETRYARLLAEKMKQAAKPQAGNKPGNGSAGNQSQAGSGSGSASGNGSGSYTRPHPSTWGGVLPAPKPQAASGSGDGSGSDQSNGSNPASGSVKPMSESDWMVAVEQADRVCKSAGIAAGMVVRESRANRKPVEDCWASLKHIMSSLVPDDYSWNRPNRRFIGSGLILPSLASDSLGEIVIAIDTSGSVGSTAIADFLDHMQLILDQYKPSKLHLIEVDTEVTKHTEFDTYSDLNNVTVRGGGGTLFQPAFNWVEKNLDVAPSVLIYLTDGYPADRCIDPGYPVIWGYCQFSNPQDAEFGITIRLPRYLPSY